MPSLRKLRKHLDIVKNRNTCIATLKDIIEGNVVVDMDVFLSSRGRNLQRGLVWSHLQKEQFILSWLKRAYIPPFSVVHDKEGLQEKFQIIDGKQRLSTLLSFINNEFYIGLEGRNYFFNNLPDELQGELLYSHIEGNIAYSYDYAKITDEQKIEWFRGVNFAGSPVELEHMKGLDLAIQNF
jgi:hypothetical protein